MMREAQRLVFEVLITCVIAFFKFSKNYITKLIVNLESDTVDYRHSEGASTTNGFRTNLVLWFFSYDCKKISMITYQIEKNLDYKEFIDVLISSSLGERRPVHDHERMRQMVASADLIITARENGQLVGIARSVSDFVYCTYLSDLAVDSKYQKKGIGKELIRQTKLATPNAKLILLSAPKAIDYYPKIGMKKHDYCFFIDDVGELK